MKIPTMAVESNTCWFAVRYLPKGARTGASRTAVDRDMVEFYDLSLADDTTNTTAGVTAGPPGFGPLGQYITRYDTTTLLADGPGTGLNLYIGIPAWSIDATAMTTVRAWLRHQHRQRPIRTVTLTDHIEQRNSVTVSVEDAADALLDRGRPTHAEDFQAALIAGDHDAATEMAGLLGVAYEVTATD
jgi:hypothetical protein